MQLLTRLLVLVFICSIQIAHASRCGACKGLDCPPVCDPCCGQMGGVSYCDSSAGRLVCNNGFYSSCYCERHAVMDFGHLQGCCLWQGGVIKIDRLTGYIVCANGAISEICSLENVPERVAW